MLPRAVSIRPRPLLCLLAIALSLGLSACAERGPQIDAKDEGLYLDAGPLTYQVQISRELNPTDIEDRSYFLGLPQGTTPTTPSQEWFGVWLQVKNEGKQVAQTAKHFRVVDTLGHGYEPLQQTIFNPFAYQPQALAPGAFQPAANSAARTSATQGSLLLFKIDESVSQNRPLLFEILDNDQPDRVVSSVKLDF
jgi:hypothetical protein